MNASGDQYELNFGPHRAVIVEVGGGLREYTVDGVAVVDGYASDEMCSGGAGQILAPWPNRVGKGHYAFDERDLQLALTEPARGNAIHGLVRWLPWSRVTQSASSVTLKQVIHPQPGYPFSVELSVHWELGIEGLRAEHRATNVGASRCPFGLGVHPYLLVPGISVDELRLHLRAERWLRVDSVGLPLEELPVAGSQYDYRNPRALGSTAVDTAYRELARENGLAHVGIAAPDGRGAELWMDDSFPWVQVFTGDTLEPKRRRRSVAIEPMTCPPDAFRTGVDLLGLDPGRSWIGRWGIRKT